MSMNITMSLGDIKAMVSFLVEQEVEKQLSLIKKEKTLDPFKKMLSIDELCLMTGYKKSYVYRLTSEGVLPYSKPNGKTIFFDKDKIEEWLLSNRKK